MKLFKKSDSQLLSGHWNDSPVEVGLTNILKSLPEKERLHSHSYYEYYVILHGSLKLEIGKEVVEAEKEMVVMVAPKEKHRIIGIDSEEGAKWIVIKQKSTSKSKKSKSS
jgi:mannose-6-phosphate isomerase-like protein (cupin superfamily)